MKYASPQKKQLDEITIALMLQSGSTNNNIAMVVNTMTQMPKCTPATLSR
jgi:hypothetical protein